MKKFVILIICCAFSATTAQPQLFPQLKSNLIKNALTFPFLNRASSPKTLEEAKELIKFEIRALMNALALPSFTFGIRIHNKTIWTESWGEADLENAVAASSATHYRLASISKTFTSIFIGTLVDQDLLSYEDSIWKYISEADYPRKSFNGQSVEITVGQLLSNTAGTHYTQLADFDTLVTGINCTQMIHKFNQEPVAFVPGSDWQYSNYGFQLLGAIIESVAGKTYQDSMQVFFSELGLSQTMVETTTLMIKDRARYFMFPGLDTPTPNVTGNIPTMTFDQLFIEEGWWPSGGLMSTVDDLLSYGQAILNAWNEKPGAVLSKATLSEIWTKRTEHCPNFGPGYRPINEYGYGFFLANITAEISPDLKYRSFVWHSGGMVGVSTFLAIYPEQDTVVVALTNKGYVIGLDQISILAIENIYELTGSSGSATAPPSILSCLALLFIAQIARIN